MSSLLIGSTAVAGLVVSLLTTRIAWALMGFECVVLMASVQGILVWRGRIRRSVPLAAATLSGVTLASSLLAYLAVREELGQWATAGVAVRAVLCAAVAAVACWSSLARCPGAMGRFVRGVLAGVPALLLTWAVMTPARDAIVSALRQVGVAALPAAVFLASAVFVISACASVHWVVEAFAMTPGAAKTGRRVA